jgi:hypothetical protein
MDAVILYERLTPARFHKIKLRKIQVSDLYELSGYIKAGTRLTSRERLNAL